MAEVLRTFTYHLRIIIISWYSQILVRAHCVVAHCLTKHTQVQISVGLQALINYKDEPIRGAYFLIPRDSSYAIDYYFFSGNP